MVTDSLEQWLSGSVFVLLLTFVRLGTIVMIMPGVGDSFVPRHIRLYMALGLSFMLAPLTAAFLPSPLPADNAVLPLIVSEFIVGLFIGTITRILISALDTGGMVISMLSGLGNAQIFNPNMAVQGSLVGAFLSVTGSTVILASGLHHLLFAGMLQSYYVFPPGEIPEAASMAQLVARAVSTSFMIGVQIGAPFIVVGLLIYIGMGVLARLMPQVQVFILALPLQIVLAFLTLSLVTSAIMLFWTEHFAQGIRYLLNMP